MQKIYTTNSYEETIVLYGLMIGRVAGASYELSGVNLTVDMPIESEVTSDSIYTTELSVELARLASEAPVAATKITSPDKTKTATLSLDNNNILYVNGIPVNFMEEAGYEFTTYDSKGRTSNITLWTDNTKTTKVREILVTYNSSSSVNTITTKYYSSGSLVKTITETHGYTSNKLTSKTRVIS